MKRQMKSDKVSKVIEVINKIESSRRASAGLVVSISKSKREVFKAASLSSDTIQCLSELIKIAVVLEKASVTLKLLALNASIKAAEAEDMGLGFDQVAKNINKVSEEVAQEIQSFGSVKDDLLAKVEEISDGIVSVESAITAASVALEDEDELIDEVIVLKKMLSGGTEQVKGEDNKKENSDN